MVASWLHRLLRDRAGNFAVMTAVLTPVMMSLAAVAIDTGALFLERRQLQAAADIAALAAAAQLRDPVPGVLAALSDNGFVGVSVVEHDKVVAGALPSGTPLPAVVVATGRYEPLADRPAAERFVVDASDPNAARVTVYKHGQRYFGAAIIGTPRISAQGTAGGRKQASFSIGSRLLRLEGGIANQLLGALTGSSIGLSVMDYNALLDTRVSLLGFLDALATELRVTAGTYDQLLDANADLPKVLAALGRVEGLAWPARNALAALRQAIRPNQPPLALDRLLDLGALGRQPIGVHAGGLAASIGVMDLVSAAAAIANGSRQVELDLGATIPGLLTARVNLAIGEPPQGATWYAVGSAGDLVRTAQTRLYLETRIGGPGGLLGSVVNLPLYLEVAYGEARIADISCPTGQPESTRVQVTARPGVASLWLAEVNPAALGGTPVPAKADLVTVPLLVSVKARAMVDVGQMQPRTLSFDRADISAAGIKRVSTTQTTTSLVSSLLGNLQLEINVLGLGIGLPGNITAVLRPLLVAATTPLDTVLSEVLAVLGITIGEADVSVNAADCGRPVLVQ